MIQGNQNQLNKAVFALILHTLQEADSEEIKKDEKRETEKLHLDKGESYSFVEI